MEYKIYVRENMCSIVHSDFPHPEEIYSNSGIKYEYSGMVKTLINNTKDIREYIIIKKCNKKAFCPRYKHRCLDRKEVY